jgi:solute carrier family 25 protein 39/40
MTTAAVGSPDEHHHHHQQQQQHRFHHTQEEILLSNMVSGFIAGGIAAGATTPFDVVKTRHQIAARSVGSKSPSVWTTLKLVHAEQGMEGLFSGLKPRAYRAAPACGIVISVYELLKAWLTPE